MATDLSIFQGTLITQYCNFSFVSNGLLSYIILIIISVGLYWGLYKKGNTIYTILPVVFITNFFISLIIYSFPCTVAPAISGKFVIIMAVLAGLFTALRVAYNEN